MLTKEVFDNMRVKLVTGYGRNAFNANMIMNFISSEYVLCYIMLRVEWGVVMESRSKYEDKFVF